MFWNTNISYGFVCSQIVGFITFIINVQHITLHSGETLYNLVALLCHHQTVTTIEQVEYLKLKPNILTDKQLY